MGFDGGVGDEELCGDFGVGEAACDEGEDFVFAWCEFDEGARGGGWFCGACELADQAFGDGGGDERVAGGGDSDGRGELFGWDVFEEEAAGAGAECFVDVFVEVEGGEHEYGDGLFARLSEDSAGGVDPVESGHADVHEDNMGGALAGESDCVVSVLSLANDHDVGFVFQDCSEPCPYKCLVIGDQHRRSVARGSGRQRLHADHRSARFGRSRPPEVGTQCQPCGRRETAAALVD